MLSAVENFGPLVGPAVPLSHHPRAATHHHHVAAHQSQHHHHAADRCYALDIVAGPATDASVRVSTALSPTPAPAPVTVAQQSPFIQAQLTQLNTLQALKLQQQFQRQYEQHLNNFLNASQPPSIAGISALPHRPQPQIATLSEAGAALGHKPQRNHHQQQQQSISVNLTRVLNTPKYFSSPRETSMMPTTEFTPPTNPKHEQPSGSCTLESAQSGPMNLVTNASNAFAGNTNYHQLSASNNNSNSNPATIDSSRPSSSSSSVDVENDESMSPISIPAQIGRKPMDPAALHNAKQPTYSETSASSAAAAVVAAYQYNYSQLYSGGRAAGLYNPPVIFSVHNPHISHVVTHPNSVHTTHVPPAYLGAMGTHSPAVSPGGSTVYSAEYLKALQNAVAAGVFQAASPNATPTFQTSQLTNNNSLPAAGVNKSKLHSPTVGPMVALDAATSPPPKAEQRNTTKLSTGTYLYEKAKGSPPDTTDTDSFFKIPSGKEGSLKHRILTRPTNVDRTTEAGKTTVMRTHASTSIFKKGSYIELSNGLLRRVEDMRTEDFIQCAERSPRHQLVESTVVKMNNNPLVNTVVIAFSYDRNQSKVDMEVATDHPFFVYGQGWASCNPEMSLKAFGLKCQRLQVGDICISLAKREPPNINLNNNNSNISSSSNKLSYLHDTAAAAARSPKTPPTPSSEAQGLERDLQPLVLSDNAYAPHLKSAGVCLPTAQYPILRGPHGTVHFVPPHLSATAATHPTYAAVDNYARFSFPTPAAQSTPLLHVTGAQRRDPSTAPPAAAQPSHPTQDDLEQSTSARKRRWSAPESFSNSDDDEAIEYQPPLRQKSAPTAAVSSNYRPYLPANMPSGESNCDFPSNYK